MSKATVSTTTTNTAISLNHGGTSPQHSSTLLKAVEEGNLGDQKFKSTRIAIAVIYFTGQL
jgi:hypothetical protein